MKIVIGGAVRTGGLVNFDKLIYKMIVFFILVLLIMILTESCQTIVPEIKIDTPYKMDMRIKNLKKEAIGMIVLEEKPLYTIEFESSGRFDLFTFRTCSREIAIEKAKKGLNRHKFKINYRPNLIEMRNGCDAEIRGYDIKGRHAQGFISFSDKYLKMPAMIICGGKTKNQIGVSVCQQKTGLIQAITFMKEVAVKTDERCKFDKERGQNFEYEIKSGFCVYTFMETKPPHSLHKLTTYGYEKILIRE